MAEFDFYGVVLHSPEVILSFVFLSREDLRAYDAGEIDLGGLCRRCDGHGQLVWDPKVSLPKLRGRWRLHSGLVKSHWEEFKSRRAVEGWSEGTARFELIAVSDCSVDGVKKRTAAAALDVLPGKSTQLQLPELAEQLVRAADRARVELPATAAKAARRRGRCDRVWVSVFSRRIRPRDAEGCGFVDPYLLTVEYSATGEFQRVKYVDHDVDELGKYRVSIKRTSP